MRDALSQSHRLDKIRQRLYHGPEPRPGRLVLFTFPSEQAARDWYNDPDYQTLSEHRRAGTDLKFLTLVHGLPPRS